MSPRPNRARSTSSLKPVRIVDVANTYMDLSTLTTDENRQILLTGIRKTISIKEIETILKSDLLKRNDDLEDIKVDRVHGEAVVMLKNGRAASDVLDKAKPEGKVTLQDTEVYVSPLNQAPIDPRKMFVFDFDKSFEDMILYDDATLGTRPTKEIRGENRTAVLLCFDIDVSQDQTFQHLLTAYKWNMLPVERTNRVRIKGVSMETTPEDVKDYFNKKLSNDESITSMEYREHLGDYIITFSTINDAERVENQEINSINGK
ncbi:uncharacterized protein LOC132755442 [Ruditapes philippinarum]|uniref:uncharacterized protein LOC132755442 n=1 Tax=Ruditapes philippinarum TaxID=129788 RepID=UPI00295A5808|nr:uncharacterized protein LOC132755442 [Ruditapes philippinarum]